METSAPEASAVQERRRAPRHDLHVTAIVRVPGQATLHARMTDLSLHGLGLATRRELPPETRCEVELALSVDRQIRQLRLQADAVRSEDDAAGHHRVGLKLVDLPPESLDLLERYLGVLR
ncbi:MAG: PilZ domain-containing protein [Pseudomonadota bacterium]